MKNNNRTNRRLNRQKASFVKGLLLAGYYQHEIAAYYKVNQGRISEINTGKTFSYVDPADVNALPMLH